MAPSEVNDSMRVSSSPPEVTHLRGSARRNRRGPVGGSSCRPCRAGQQGDGPPRRPHSLRSCARSASHRRSATMQLRRQASAILANAPARRANLRLAGSTASTVTRSVRALASGRNDRDEPRRRGSTRQVGHPPPTTDRLSRLLEPASTAEGRRRPAACSCCGPYGSGHLARPVGDASSRPSSSARASTVARICCSLWQRKRRTAGVLCPPQRRGRGSG